MDRLMRIGAACGLLIAGCASADRVVLDGAFDDWDGAAPKATDPTGDATGAFDLERVTVRTAGTAVFVHLGLAERETGPVNLQSGAADEGTLVISLETETGARAVFDTREKGVAMTTAGGREREAGWAAIGYTGLPTYASDAYELRFDASLLGAKVGETLTIGFGGSDELSEPLSVELVGETPAPVADAAWERHPDAAVRVVSFNTLRGGLVDPDRSRRIIRMLRAVNPDVICFQEEWETSPELAEAILNDEAVGLGGGRERGADGRTMDEDRGGDPGAWRVFSEGNGCLVATRLPATQVPAGDGRYAAAMLDLPGGGSLMAMSVHFKCCGYARSEEDERRIAEAEEVARTIASVREAGDDSPFADHRDAGVLVFGDWNLVGSRRPLDVLTRDEPSGAGLAGVELLDLNGRSAVTWYNERSAFSPGRLDLLAVSDDNMRVHRSFVVNTRFMHPRVLAAMNLTPQDSALASDHLMLVADLSVASADDTER